MTKSITELGDNQDIDQLKEEEKKAEILIEIITKELREVKIDTVDAVESIIKPKERQQLLHILRVEQVKIKKEIALVLSSLENK